MAEEIACLKQQLEQVEQLSITKVHTHTHLVKFGVTYVSV